MVNAPLPHTHIAAHQCLLFMAYALMQLGHLKAARRVIEHVWIWTKTTRADKVNIAYRPALPNVRHVTCHTGAIVMPSGVAEIAGAVGNMRPWQQMKYVHSARRVVLNNRNAIGYDAICNVQISDPMQKTLATKQYTDTANISLPSQCRIA